MTVESSASLRDFFLYQSGTLANSACCFPRLRSPGLFALVPSSIDFGKSLQPIFHADFPFTIQSPQNYGQTLITENQKMGRRNFFRGFYLKGFKGQKFVSQKPYKNLNRISPSRIQRSIFFFHSDFTFTHKIYGQTLITEYRKMGRENFNRFFIRIQSLQNLRSNPYNRISENGS